ncbi:hypothetical protein CVT25_003603 [Psilocybe cyanescens]|uniref:ribonuclease H n=1 Tax=Psilocybe cyanescens TaxID=93625 RepID=A0A409WZX6_PSICY|nr:hypothetical protein CVT25_003603 [Psilocybe cyanescens]
MPAIRTKGGFYAVRKGRIPGVYRSWDECREQTDKFKGAQYKKFTLEYDAWQYVSQGALVGLLQPAGPNQLVAPVAHDALIEGASFPSRLLQDSGHQPFIGQATIPTAGPPHFTGTSLPPHTYISHPSPGAASPSLHSTSHYRAQALPPMFFPDPPPSATSLQPIASSSSKTLNYSSLETITPSFDEAQSTWDVVYIHGICTEIDQFGPMAAGIGLWWGKSDRRNLSERCPGKQRTTRAQLMSILRLLELTSNSDRPLLIKTDSVYSINCFKTWIHEWKPNNWTNAQGNPIKNADVIRCIAKRLEIRSNLGHVIVLAYADQDIGSKNAKTLAEHGARLHAAPESNLEMLTDFLEREVNQLVVRFNRDVQKTDLVVLGPGDMDGNDWVELQSQKARMSSAETSRTSSGDQRLDIASMSSSDTNDTSIPMKLPGGKEKARLTFAQLAIKDCLRSWSTTPPYHSN